MSLQLLPLGTECLGLVGAQGLEEAGQAWAVDGVLVRGDGALGIHRGSCPSRTSPRDRTSPCR